MTKIIPERAAKLKILDLFSGIGGFSLGLERTGGFEAVAFCEIDPFCRRVLNKHWPDVPIYEDVRELTGERLLADGIVADVICGGFPCQDISVAGKGAGIEGERSGLWSEYARLIGEVRPRFVLVENVAALLGRGLDRVLGDLATLGFDAEWHCIPAAAVGAPHYRDRLWIVANTCDRRYGQHVQPLGEFGCRIAPNAGGNGEVWPVADANGQPLFWTSVAWPERNPWASEPDVGRVAYGVPDRLERLTALGNAVVPQIPELIGRAILDAEARA